MGICTYEPSFYSYGVPINTAAAPDDLASGLTSRITCGMKSNSNLDTLPYHDIYKNATMQYCRSLTSFRLNTLTTFQLDFSSSQHVGAMTIT